MNLKKFTEVCTYLCVDFSYFKLLILKLDHAVKLHGRTYHYLQSTSKQGGVQYFTFDAADQMLAHANSLNTIGSRNQQFIRMLDWISTTLYQEQVATNPLVQEMRQIGRYAEENALTPDFIPTINTTTMFLDVAAITADRTSGNKVIRFHRKNCARTSSIQVTDGLMEPLCYPLLFPHGIGGWDANIRKQVRFNDYLRYRMLVPERKEDGTLLMAMNKAGTREIPVNRFQLQSRLGQHYLVDMVRGKPRKIIP